jgi:parallel beta-helix repeat protein
LERYRGKSLKRKAAFVIMLGLLLAWNMLFAFRIPLADAAGTIYIRADGSVDPPSAPILNVGNVYYTFTANIYESVVVERDNIVVDGAGHVLEGTGTENGIDLSGRSNETIENMEIKAFNYGIRLWPSFNNTISGNNITMNTIGILLWSSSNNSIAENDITTNNMHGISLYALSNHNSIYGNSIADNLHGIYLYMSSNNSISGNSITANFDGLYLHTDYRGTSDYNNISGNNIKSNSRSGMFLDLADHNNIYNNDFVDNMEQVLSYYSTNVWDDGYPSGGNYWSDYTGVDLYNGPNQNVAGGDGIGDTPYVIDADNRDNYPLMEPWTPVTGVESLVVRGLDNRIYYRAYNVTTASWASWNALPGLTCDSPAAAVCGNELHIVVRSIDGYLLWHGYVNLIGGGFSGWTLLSGSTPSAPTLTSNGTALSLVVRGQDNLIYYRFYDVASHVWTGWAVLPSGSTCDGPAATMLANKLQMVVRSMDGYTIWHSSVDLSTQAFSGWELVGGLTQSKPTLTTCESRGEIILVVRGLDNVIYRNSWSGSSWAGWVGLPTGATCDGIGATVFGEMLHVVVRGMDGYTLWHGNVDLASSAFSGWALLDGSTPSPPTLTI